MYSDSIKRLPTALLKKRQASPSTGVLIWVFLRGLGAIYFAAFASMCVQVEGLIGSGGILPISDRLSVLSNVYPEEKYWLFPSLFWIDASDAALKWVCIAGMGAAVLLMLNALAKTALIVCYGLYLSITRAGQDFTAFQWDVFLLETGFLAVFLSWGSEIIVFLYRFLIARFMFMGGLVKLASGDSTWAHLTALNYHYQTQPLPSPLAYYAHHLPEWFNKASVAGVLAIELIVPVMVFLPRPYRLFAPWSFIALQSAIMLTGNYNFFNLLTVLLCLFLFDDRDMEKLLPHGLVSTLRNQQPKPGFVAHAAAGLWAGWVLMVCSTTLWMNYAKEMPAEPLRSMMRLTSAFSLVNNYGPFAVMTTERNEIIIEGSDDGSNWQEYQFYYKPGSLDQNLRWNIPHQPRLDWQMWFAALETPSSDSWFNAFMLRLKAGSPHVLSLLRYNPFPNNPPRFVRALLYRYAFSSPEQRAATGQLWQRAYLGVYWKPVDR